MNLTCFSLQITLIFTNSSKSHATVDTTTSIPPIWDSVNEEVERDSTYTKRFSSRTLINTAWENVFPMSLEFRKKFPLTSSAPTVRESWRISLFTPLRTIFFAISTPTSLRPLINTLLRLCFSTASIPIAQIYLLHLSFTSSLFTSNSSAYTIAVVATYSYDFSSCTTSSSQ